MTDFSIFYEKEMVMKSKLLALSFAFVLISSTFLPALAGENLIVYTSMKESLIGQIRDGFLKKHPGIKMDYQSAGAGKLMAKIAAERESGPILADVLWTSEVPDFFKMRQEGILEKYKPADFDNLLNPFGDDYDGSFTAARLGTLGIAINTNFIKDPPKEWSDLTKKEYNGAFGIANPALSGTSYMSVALLAKQFGWEFFGTLAQNQARIGKGSGQVVDDTASGDLVASLAVDYITNDKIQKGAPLALYYPPETLVVPSPVCIFKGTPTFPPPRNSSTICFPGKRRFSSPRKAPSPPVPTSRCPRSSSCPRLTTPCAA
jgi:iron(III) transport system substrate-binding protein